MKLTEVSEEKIIAYFNRRFGIKNREGEYVKELNRCYDKDYILLEISSLWNSEDLFPIIDELEVHKDYWDGDYWTSENYKSSWNGFKRRNNIK